MRTLFIKIFLWFWLAMAGLTVLVTVVGSLTASDVVWPGRRTLTAATTLYAETAVLLYEQQGAAAVEHYLRRVLETAKLQAALLDESGQPLAGAPPPDWPMGRDGARREDFTVVDGKTFLLRPVTGTGGRRYLLATVFDRNLLPPPPMWTRARVIRLVVFVLGSGVVCYGLAWYLTRPIGRLRRTAQRLAAGDLAARTGAKLGRLTDEIGGLARDFDAMAERIESLVTAQRRLFGDISHELRSPLARLRVALELAQRKAGEEARPYLERIERDAERLDELVGQLLALARLESEATLAESKMLDVAALTQEVATDADFEARAAGRTVTCRIASEAAHQRILGDEELLRRALENVMRNAVRHTPEGSSVEVTVDAKERNLLITVRDHGKGVPSDALEAIFKPFYRVETARDRASGGVGLGLAIAAQAVQLHGGCITAENLADGFQVTLALPTLGGVAVPAAG
ncbi:MAG: ATP-binding protein [Chloracidobacterium sp.]|nr:ATP-binding protein [Chloracidobacterium sp.]MDW8217700.1 ATP-binding protein [Acidobacteriota bacterium]